MKKPPSGGKDGSSFKRRLASHSASRRTHENGQKPEPTFILRRFITKDKKMSIRISEVDLQKIHHKAQQAKLSLTDYVTRCCLEKQITVIEGLDEVVRQQKAIGRNLNQLTTLANMGRISSVYLKDVTEQYSQVSDLLSDILIRRRWNDGSR